MCWLISKHFESSLVFFWFNSGFMSLQSKDMAMYDSYSFILVEVYFLDQNVVLGKCSVWAQERGTFCSCWIKQSINVIAVTSMKMVISVTLSLVTLACWICQIIIDIDAYWNLQMLRGNYLHFCCSLAHFCLTYFYDLLLGTNTVRNILLSAPFLLYWHTYWLLAYKFLCLISTFSQ